MKSRRNGPSGSCIKNDRLRDIGKSLALIGYMRISKADGSQLRYQIYI
jgi:hypothetical protein